MGELNVLLLPPLGLSSVASVDLPTHLVHVPERSEELSASLSEPLFSVPAQVAACPLGGSLLRAWAVAVARVRGACPADVVVRDSLERLS